MSLLISLMFIAYFGGGYMVFEISGYGVTVLDLLTLLFYLLFLKRVIWDGDKLRFRPNAALFSMIIFMLFVFVSGLSPLFKGSPDQIFQFFKSSIHVLFLFLFPLICAVYPFKSDTWTNVIRIWLLLSILINIFGVYQIVARAYDLPLAWLNMNNVSLHSRDTGDFQGYRQLSLHFGSFFRATSIFSEPSALAGFNVYIQTFLIVPFVSGAKQFFKSNVLMIFIFAISMMGLFLAYSMTGVVGFLMVIGSVFLFQRSKKIIPIFYIALIAVAVILITDNYIQKYAKVSVVKLFTDRIEGILSGQKSHKTMAGESFMGRAENIKDMLLIWEINPILGTGYGLTQYAEYEKKVYFSTISVLAALAETGIFGFTAYVMMFVFLFVQTLKYLILKDNYTGLPPELRRLSIIAFYIMLPLFLTNFISGNNIGSYAFWNPLAIVFSVINLIDRHYGRGLVTISAVKVPFKYKFIAAMDKYLVTRKELADKG